MNTSRFAISLHILTLLEKSCGTVLSSERIAGSININPVLVRKEIGNLRLHGLVQTIEGNKGGSKLAKPASQISLAGIFQAVKQKPLLLKSPRRPNPKCPVGRQINKQLDLLYKEVENMVSEKFGETNLRDFAARF